MSVSFDRVALITRDAQALAGFYCTALGFTRDPEASQLLRLGAQRISLARPDEPGQDYPRPALSNDPWFQHIAIVVSNIGTAFERVMKQGATPISSGGPQTLPKSSGGVTAWKFRDPEFHPVELLQFPPDAMPDYWQAQPRTDICLGIDHSAIVVADTARSIKFYETLGFTVSTRSHNRGAEQAALDDLPAPDVLVTAMILPGQAAPHLELLQYCAPATVRPPVLMKNEIAATRLVFNGQGGLRRDPDGHFLTGC